MSTMGEIEYTCPICGQTFSFMTQFSYTTFGCNLDFKPFGAATIPTPIPKCTKCNFAFSDELFDENDITLLKDILQKNNIYEIEPNMPDYYYLAKECELLNKDIDTITFYYSSAIWENENKNVFKKLTKILLEYIDKIDRKNDNYYLYQLIKLDYLRRLKKFSEAKEVILTLCNDEEFPDDKFMKVLEYQFELINKEDIEEHEMPK